MSIYSIKNVVIRCNCEFIPLKMQLVRYGCRFIPSKILKQGTTGVFFDWKCWNKVQLETCYSTGKAKVRYGWGSLKSLNYEDFFFVENANKAVLFLLATSLIHFRSCMWSSGVIDNDVKNIWQNNWQTLRNKKTESRT